MHRFSTRFRADFHFLEPVNDQPYWRMSFERQKAKVNETSRGLSFDCAYLFQDASIDYERNATSFCHSIEIRKRWNSTIVSDRIMAKDWLNGLHAMYLFQNWSPKHVYTYIKINTLLIENTIFIHQRSDQLPGIIHARLKGQSFTCPGNTYNRFSNAWWGGRVERHHQRSELVALWRVSKERKTRGRQFRRARTQLRITRRNVARNRAELVPRPASSPTNFNRGAASLFAGS